MTTFGSNYGTYGIYPQQNPQIYYSYNNTATQEKSGKVPSEQECKQLSKHYLGAVKAPKASTLKEIRTAFEKWIERYTSRPHRYNTDKIERNVDAAIDFLDTTLDTQSQPSKKTDSPSSLNTKV